MKGINIDLISKIISEALYDNIVAESPLIGRYGIDAKTGEWCVADGKNWKIATMSSDYKDKRVDELWAQLYDPMPQPTTEKEIMNDWEEFEALLTGDRDPFKEGDHIKHDAKDARVKECHGKNVNGMYEYYIEYCLPVYGGCYVTEDEICHPSTSKKAADIPPPVSNICKHKNAYENIISSSLSFWVCPDCKKEVDKPVKHLSQDEIDDLFGW